MVENIVCNILERFMEFKINSVEYRKGSWSSKQILRNVEKTHGIIQGNGRKNLASQSSFLFTKCSLPNWLNHSNLAKPIVHESGDCLRKETRDESSVDYLVKH